MSRCGMGVARGRPMRSAPISMFAALLTVLLVAACTGHPSVEEVVDRSTPPICDKTKECAGAAFTVAYPGGVDECVTKTKVEAKKKYGNDLSKNSSCTDEELNKCLQDFKALACPAGGGRPKVPCDC